MSSRRRASAAVFLALCAACLVALAGNGSSLPLDDHEVFVARTAEEMMARGSFLLPYFNDEPRVNKPPLCYWLVMGVDRLNGGDGIVSEWEARVPSIIAGIVLVGATIALGALLGGSWIGVLAGMLVCSTTGFITYTHSARPEMVYAALCSLGLVGFAAAHRRRQRGGSGSGVLQISSLAWLAMGLAALTKGPHLPLLLICGWTAALFADGQRGSILKSIRPLSGGLILICAWLWWYLLLWRLVPDLDDALNRETTSGRIFNFDEGRAWRYLDPYYLYRTAGLVVPWVLLYIAGVASPWIKQLRRSRPIKLSWWIIAVPLVVMHVSLGRRWYYMLPVMAPLGVLMAACCVRAGRLMLDSGKTGFWKSIVLIHILMLVAAAIALVWPMDAALSAVCLSAVAAGAIVGTAFVLREAPGTWEHRVRRDLLITTGIAALAFGVMAANMALWTARRFDRRQFSLQIRSVVPPDAPLLGWQPRWETEQYYCHRAIPSFLNIGDLTTEVRHWGTAFVLVEQPLDIDVRELDREVILTSPIDTKGRHTELWRFTSPESH